MNNRRGDLQVVVLLVLIVVTSVNVLFLSYYLKYQRKTSTVEETEEKRISDTVTSPTPVLTRGVFEGECLNEGLPKECRSSLDLYVGNGAVMELVYPKEFPLIWTTVNITGEFNGSLTSSLGRAHLLYQGELPLWEKVWTVDYEKGDGPQTMKEKAQLTLNVLTDEFPFINSSFDLGGIGALGKYDPSNKQWYFYETHASVKPDPSTVNWKKSGTQKPIFYTRHDIPVYELSNDDYLLHESGYLIEVKFSSPCRPPFYGESPCSQEEWDKQLNDVEKIISSIRITALRG